MSHVDNPFESPVILSFCPGILGIERGLARVGVECCVAAYVEIEAYIIANLVTGMEAGLLAPAPIWTDAKTFDARPFRGKIHGIIGGYPCPGESLAGLREGHLYKGFIWPSIRKAIAASRPLWCFFENVDDHLTGTYPLVQRSLRNMGYAVEAGIYTAEEVGAPHERQRLFILAIMADFKRQGLEEWFKQSAWQERTSIKRSREKVGDYYGERLSGNRDFSFQDQENTSTAGASADLWPAGQGIYQHDWEYPRTIKPGVGCTIHGYNFREDILRSLGNSVVEQTAELAFRDLIRKHFDHV